MRLLQGLLTLAYPVLVFLALDHLSPRSVALLLALLLILRPPTRIGALLSARRERVGLAALVVLMLAASLSDSEALLRLYPALVNGLMLALFAHSLRHPPSVVERLARLREPDLPAAGVAYTRRVTAVWCGFFIVNGSLAAWTALFASRETWAWYNGLVAYLLMGTLFAGEWLVRKRVRGRTA